MSQQLHVKQGPLFKSIGKLRPPGISKVLDSIIQFEFDQPDGILRGALNFNITVGP